jgi:farnesyl-diphosphate farnesyltransferase
LAYLLARASDTIADTQAVARGKRILCLRDFAHLTRVPQLGAIAGNQALPAERLLLERLGEALEMLNQFHPLDRRLIQQLLETITTGQIFDLEKFPGESERDLVALATDVELDRYTYLVAGCVGEFWTKICAAHLPAWSDKATPELGVRFGQGLQLVNILRDLPRDLRIGRCYLPVSQPDRLLEPGNFGEIRQQYQHWLDTAVEHLDAGWKYTLAIPARLWRVRLACTWPIWIGLETIARLRHANPLDAAQRIVVPRATVNNLLVRSVWACLSRRALDRHSRQLPSRRESGRGSGLL